MTAAAKTISTPARVLRFLLSLTVGALAITLMAAVLTWGWDYYTLPQMRRPFHPYHSLLRPSSYMGLVLGAVATGLLVLNLGYLVRKRLIAVRWLGSLRTWLDFHVVTGIVGGALIFFHAAFAPCSALGILALAALLVTVVTGIIGRYVYVHVPHSLEGRELELEQVREQLDCCRRQLEEIGIRADWLHLRDAPAARERTTGVPRSFLSLIIGDHQRRRDYRQLRRAVLSSSQLRPSARQILPLVRVFCRQWQWMVRYHEWRGLLASWRFFHRWLAIVMLTVASFHILLAVRFGDLTILGGAR